MIKIAICDAQKGDRAKTKEYCQKYFEDNPLLYEMQEFTSGESFFETDFPDVLLLEMNLGRMTGLQVKEVLELKRAKTAILFVTAQIQEMHKAFGRNVYGFLQKPLDYKVFSQKMRSVIEDIYQEKSSVFCKKGDNIQKVYIKDIMYIESYGRYTKVYVRGESEYLLLDKCMGDWLDKVDAKAFVRCHRCYLVNLDFVKEIDQNVMLKNKITLPLSRGEKRIFCKAFEEYLEESYDRFYEKVL